MLATVFADIIVTAVLQNQKMSDLKSTLSVNYRPKLFVEGFTYQQMNIFFPNASRKFKPIYIPCKPTTIQALSSFLP